MTDERRHGQLQPRLSKRLVEVMRLLSESFSVDSEIERRAMCTAAEFFRHYYAASRPVVFTDFTSGWPALGWTPKNLAAQYGHVVVEITSGRNADPLYDWHYKKLSRKITLSDFVSMLSTEQTPTNDFYLISNNRAMELDALAELIKDFVLPRDIIDVDVLPARCSLWMGPKGTITSLHYDPGHLILCQFFGRKRVTLVPPWNLTALQSLKGYYVMGAVPEPDGLQVDILPGDSIFIPAGWYHHVQALDTSISFSLTCFRRQNSYIWYKPGFV